MARIVVITTPDTVVYVSNDDVIHIDIVGGGSVIIRAMPGETVTLRNGHLYIDGKFERHFKDTDYVNDPYFGVFASTNEYKPSIWLFEYFEVSYLNN